MRTVFACLVACAAATPLHAANLTADNPAAIADLLQSGGYRAELGTDNTGDPKITSAAGGVKFSILFYGCEANKACTSIQFSAGFDLPNGTTLMVANGWNSEKRYASTYLDDENDPYLQMDQYLSEGGLTPEAFTTVLGIWERQVSDFKVLIDF